MAVTVSVGHMKDLNAFQRDLLRVVAGNENGAKGLALMGQLESYYGSEVNHGRLYPNLDRLEDKGLITIGQFDKRTNRYEITERGERELAARRQWEEAVADGVTADA